ncbi:trypsin-like peptidase domain-containing protein [Streptomyces sp. S3(2020)]|uniref:VMAP-C domain-containing protein n=1 Tax=Streptomyces sp. S3(2020) TaxID=2732044 RepID=UPI00148954AB|nr:trypsin-like peptidase domain-containing protein [Streptomyces sp. S3(2020)]NNN36346.1 trypsin-like peptidase domain-containing protein [Streptomyces sp. S3(2020)]
MTDAEWHARVECAGKVIGAGFLVAPGTVLTCAHVALDRGPLTVAFPQRPGSLAVPARVVAHGDWAGGPADPGDLAVLELAQEVTIAPAALAPAATAHGDRKLVAYGFPAGWDEGTLAEYRTTGPVLVGGEWIQLEAWSGHGQPLAAGFSGAAVTLVETGEVVGMVTAAADARDVRTGRMMPTDVMRRHWPGLEGLVPAAGSSVLAARRRLRALVERAIRVGLDCDPVRLYNDAVAGDIAPPPPPEGFDSLWSAAWFVQSELDDPAAVTRFADRLATLLGPRPTPRRTTPAWAPILIELGHSGAGEDLVRVEVSAYSGGRRHPVGSDTVPHTRLRSYVQDRIDAAFRHVPPDADELIAFALPRDWLDWPVDSWESDPDDDTPLGLALPVVVTDHARRKARTRHALTRAWNRLDTGPRARVHRVACGCPGKPGELRLALLESEPCLAGFAAAPGTDRTREHFRTSLVAPAPVIVWSRRGCGTEAACADVCPGTAFLDSLDAHVSRVRPADLPRSVLALRREAAAEDGHWAQDIQLLWDDPRCFTDPHEEGAHLRSPVAGAPAHIPPHLGVVRPGLPASAPWFPVA